MHLLLTLSACALLGAAEPKSLLTLTELDQDGHATVVPTSSALVDIGSDIRVQIDVDRLRQLTSGATATPKTQQLLADYQALTEASTSLSKVLEPLAQAFRTYASNSNPTDESRAEFQAAITRSASARRQLLAYLVDRNAAPSRSRQRLRAAVNAVLDREGSAADIYAAIAQAATQEVALLREELDATLEAEGVYLQLGAFLVTPEAVTPIHLQGFDDYLESPRSDHDRWRITLTDPQKQQLEGLTATARTVNDKGFDELARTEGPKVFTRQFENTAVALDGLIASLKALEAGTTAEVAALRAQVVQVRTEANAYRDFLLGLVAKYRSPATTTSFTDFLVGTNSDLEEVIRRATALSQALVALRAKVAPLVGTVAELAQPVLAGLDAAGKALRAELELNAKQITQGIATLFAVHQVNTAALVFGEQVKKLTLDEFPSETRFALPSAGRRAPGDSVVVKLGMGRAVGPPKEFEVRRFLVYRLLAHFETVVALVFAERPKVEGLDSPGLFHLAPSYSVLLKGGPRGSHVWNSILTPGLGLNLSALDFNRDGTPELGLGATVALFRDILQVGYGYNVFQNKGYFFFGLGLPMPTFGGLPSAVPDVNTAR